MLSAAFFIPDVSGAAGATDYPDWAIRKEKSAAALVDVVVDPAGRVISCKPQQTFGDERLAGQICSKLSARDMKSARDATGTTRFFADTVLVRSIFRATRKVTASAHCARVSTLLSRLPACRTGLRKLLSIWSSTWILRDESPTAIQQE
ncbi:hypothetical protein GCM10011371_12310 [Novosphingobium marinum]|nr:hypothetical protein GCM10011371_12310 [Novosphingobium marinum]